MSLYCVTAPHFVAGFEALNGKITNAAPIISWAVGRELSYFEAWCRLKKYDCAPVNIEVEVWSGSSPPEVGRSFVRERLTPVKRRE